jgi:hypothetical protein
MTIYNQSFVEMHEMNHEEVEVKTQDRNRDKDPLNFSARL